MTDAEQRKAHLEKIAAVVSTVDDPPYTAEQVAEMRQLNRTSLTATGGVDVFPSAPPPR